jgi:hypothetical protein|tara:strand:- start:2760 stop:3806 length:1047 start_codon:yes stop_codon:yes gene_type:complete
MAKYDTRVEQLVGPVTTGTDLDDWCSEGAKVVINAMPQRLLENIKQVSSFTASQSVSGRKIIDVLRNDGTIDQPCRRVPAMMRGRVTDTKDMNYALGSDPVYYIHGETCFVKPAPDADAGIMMYVGYPSIDASADDVGSLDYFPTEHEHLIVLYASLKALHQKLNEQSNAIPSTPTVIPMSSIVYSGPDNQDVTEEIFVVEPFVPPIMESLDFDDTEKWITDEEDAEMLQARINEMQTKIAQYNARLQTSVQDFQSANQINLAQGQADLQVAVSNKDRDLQRLLQNAVNDMQTIINENQASLGFFQADMGRYQAEVGTLSAEYQWIHGQYMLLKGEYQEGMQMLIQGL